MDVMSAKRRCSTSDRGCCRIPRPAGYLDPDRHSCWSGDRNRDRENEMIEIQKENYNYFFQLLTGSCFHPVKEVRSSSINYFSHLMHISLLHISWRKVILTLIFFNLSPKPYYYSVNHKTSLTPLYNALSNLLLCCFAERFIN